MITRRAAVVGAAGGALTAALAACGTKHERRRDHRALPTKPGGTLGLGIVGLFVADLATSLDLYRRLGLDIPSNVDVRSGSFRLRTPNDQIFFWETYAYTRRGGFPDYQPAVGDRKVALEFGFRTPADVDAMYAALITRGAHSTFAPHTWGSIRYAVLTDPDDNQIALRHPRTT